MIAEEHFRNGNLQEALEALQVEVRKQPDNGRHRIFLFQLLAVLGQWQRALNQLNVLGKLDPEAWPMVHMYNNAIQCEVLRLEIFAGRKKPLILGDPPPWVAWLLESLRFMANNQYEEAVSLRNKAFDLAVTSTGKIDETSFTWIADADSRLGPVLEIILNGRYYWAPFQQIRSIRIKEPGDLHDLVWLPAEFTWANGGQTFGLIPSRYPNSETADDTAIQLARRTEWVERSEDIYEGLGQRMFSTNQEDYPLLDVREVSIE